MQTKAEPHCSEIPPGKIQAEMQFPVSTGNTYYLTFQLTKYEKKRNSAGFRQGPAFIKVRPDYEAFICCNTT